MRQTGRTILTALTSMVLLTGAALAEDVYWNDPFVESILREKRIYPQRGTIAGILQSEAFVQSERLSRNGIQILKKDKSLLKEHQVDFADIMADYWQVAEVKNPDGSTSKFMRPMSPQEVQNMKYETAGTSSELIATQMDIMSDGLIMLGGALRRGIHDSKWRDILADEEQVAKMIRNGDGKKICENLFYEMRDTGIPDPDESWGGGKFDMGYKGMVTPDGKIAPLLYVMGPACMLTASAAELDKLPEEDTLEAFKKAQENVNSEIEKHASIVGEEVIDGHLTKEIAIKGLTIEQTMDDGSTVTINNMHFWIDPEYFVRRKFRMEGVIKRGRKTEEFYMERENQDYRRVGDTYLYEPYREVMRMGGMLSDKQRRELAKAQAELEKAKAQLAQMPAAQRAMVESMMASQMAQLESMANDGTASVTVVVTDIEINPGFADTPVFSFNESAHSKTLIRMIQADLDKLGFEPGPVTGTINAATSSAISKYQASRDMTVNGAPSPELATALQAEVNAL